MTNTRSSPGCAVVSRSDLGFINSEEFRRYLRIIFPREDGYTHKRIGEELGLSAGFVGMLLKGTRKPSKAALDALKMEAVIFYRKKSDPFTGKPWGAAMHSSNLHSPTENKGE